MNNFALIVMFFDVAVFFFLLGITFELFRMKKVKTDNYLTYLLFKTLLVISKQEDIESVHKILHRTFGNSLEEVYEECPQVEEWR